MSDSTKIQSCQLLSDKNTFIIYLHGSRETVSIQRRRNERGGGRGGRGCKVLLRLHVVAAHVDGSPFRFLNKNTFSAY